jgi:hypothetical protein
MMRAWENRPDTVVVDEPLYAFYLAETGLDHPGRDEVIASQPTSWPEVLRGLTGGPLPAGVTIEYAKHMTHHVLPSVDLAAFAPFRHAFLIRDPRALLASYARVRSAPALDDLGLRQQARLFAEFGGPVIDSGDLLAGTAGQRRRLGAALVRQRVALHRVRAGAGPARPGGPPGPRPRARAAARAVPPVLREAAGK